MPFSYFASQDLAEHLYGMALPEPGGPLSGMGTYTSVGSSSLAESNADLGPHVSANTAWRPGIDLPAFETTAYQTGFATLSAPKISPRSETSSEISVEAIEAQPAPVSNIAFVFDSFGNDWITASPASEIFVFGRDAQWDRIIDFTDGEDLLDITAFEVTFDSLRIRRVSLEHYEVYTRDEGITVIFDEASVAAADADDWLLDIDDFIFATGLPEPPVQVIIETNSTEREELRGTTLPDIFTFAQDDEGDVINLFEPGKDIIDLSAFNTSFEDLEIVTRYPGRVSVRISVEGDYDWIQINDPSRLMVAEDFTADDFIF